MRPAPLQLLAVEIHLCSIAVEDDSRIVADQLAERFGVPVLILVAVVAELRL
jgi:hypothetical protein